jgi:hypothetical protein
MVLYNLYLVLNHEMVNIYDNATHSIVYEGLSEYIPDELMSELVHSVTMTYEKKFNRGYFLIDLN